MPLGRRQLITRAFAACAAGLAPGLARAVPEAAARRLSFENLHTGERLSAAYWEGGAYAPDALAAVNRVLRDHRTGEVHAIEPRLLDLLSALARQTGAAGAFQVISGYRSPASNAALHARSNGVASHSLHMEGKAIDVRLAGVELSRLRDAALVLGVGGVGYYPTSGFVHVDVGRVRRWTGA